MNLMASNRFILIKLIIVRSVQLICRAASLSLISVFLVTTPPPFVSGFCPNPLRG